MDALIQEILEATAHPSNPYLVALADGSLDLEDFTETQIQFYYAVVFFNRPMAACAAKIPSTRLHREILRNVRGEHGEGEDEDAHGETFLAFLAGLAELTPNEVRSRTLWPEVRMFNTTLTGASKVVSDMLGHASVSLTLDTYSHVLPDNQAQAAIAMDTLFG